MRSILAAFTLASCLAVTAMGGPMEGLFEKGALWDYTQEKFNLDARPLGFVWTTASWESARCGPNARLTFGGLSVVEAVARFSEGKMSELTAALYTRGDVGDMERSEFEYLVKRSVDVISGLTGVKPQMRGKDVRNAVKAEGVIWQTAQSQLLLEYAISRVVTGQSITYRPEFLRLEIRPLQKKQALPKEPAIASKQDIKTRVKRGVDGDVWLDGIPMVDQGEKGYCLVASSERVLRYYGMRVDQYELAQLAGSDSKRGTDLKSAQDGLKVAGSRLHFRVKTADEPDLRQFEALVQDYNRRSAKYGKGLQVPAMQGEIDPFQIMGEMRIEALRDVRMSQRAEMGRFIRSAVNSVEAGQPLIWGVVLGLVPEAGLKQKAGGHVRLIVGYNSRTNEILYSDSWGAGHELKRMSAGDAWLIHSFSLSLSPW